MLQYSNNKIMTIKGESEIASFKRKKNEFDPLIKLITMKSESDVAPPCSAVSSKQMI